MKLIDDICKTPDGHWSLSKITAAVAQTVMTSMFVKVSLAMGFVPDMWLIYGGFAIGHAVADHVGNQVARFKDRRLDAETQKDPTDVQQPAPQDRPV